MSPPQTPWGCRDQWFSNLSMHYSHLGGLLQHRLLGPNPRVSASVNLGWDPLICISSISQLIQYRCPGDHPLRTTAVGFFLQTWGQPVLTMTHIINPLSQHEKGKPTPHDLQVNHNFPGNHFHWVSRLDIPYTKSPLLHRPQIVPPNLDLIP